MGCGSSGLVSSGGLEFGHLGNWNAGICMVVVVVLGVGFCGVGGMWEFGISHTMRSMLCVG